MRTFYFIINKDFLHAACWSIYKRKQKQKPEFLILSRPTNRSNVYKYHKYDHSSDWCALFSRYIIIITVVTNIEKYTYVLQTISRKGYGLSSEHSMWGAGTQRIPLTRPFSQPLQKGTDTTFFLNKIVVITMSDRFLRVSLLLHYKTFYIIKK